MQSKLAFIRKEWRALKVLIVEDDIPLLQAVARVLREEGFAVDESSRGDEALYLTESLVYDLVLLDVMLPRRDGISIVRELRARAIDTPVLLLTARDAVEDRVRGLDAGADDYLVKPFAIPELLARTRAVLRRRGALAQGELRFGGLSLRPKELEAYAGDAPLRLTQKEYELLEYLLMNKEQIVTRGQILDRVWGFDSPAGEGVVDLYIHYLRKKLAPSGCDALIHTVRGVGYMLKEPTFHVS